MSILDKLKYVDVPAAVQKGKPAASVRTNGTLVFNELAQKVVNVSSELNYFRLGKDEDENLYLIPSVSTEKGSIRAVKAGTSFMFRNEAVIKELGGEPTDRYNVTKEQDGDSEYFLLTKQPRVEKKVADNAPTAHGE